MATFTGFGWTIWQFECTVVELSCLRAYICEFLTSVSLEVIGTRFWHTWNTWCLGALKLSGMLESGHFCFVFILFLVEQMIRHIWRIKEYCQCENFKAYYRGFGRSVNSERCQSACMNWNPGLFYIFSKVSGFRWIMTMYAEGVFQRFSRLVGQQFQRSVLRFPTVQYFVVSQRWLMDISLQRRVRYCSIESRATLGWYWIPIPTFRKITNLELHSLCMHMSRDPVLTVFQRSNAAALSVSVP